VGDEDDQKKPEDDDPRKKPPLPSDWDGKKGGVPKKEYS